MLWPNLDGNVFFKKKIDNQYILVIAPVV